MTSKWSAANQLAGAAEARHDLVEDEDDAVPVADLPHSGEVAGRRHHDPGGAGHRLQDDRGDRLRPLEGDGLLQVRERALALLLSVCSAWKGER